MHVVSTNQIADILHFNDNGAISDHLGQFLILLYHSIITNPNKQIFKRNSKNFRKNNFLSDLTNMNWKNLLSQYTQDVNLFDKTFSG